MRKRVLLGVTGGIAAYKAAYIASRLTKFNLDVVVVMTDAATQFITPLTMETLSKNRVITDMFSRDFPYEVEHISLAKSSDLVLVAPATADFIGKAAGGLADDMLSTTYMACKGIKVMCPAMNTAMYLSEANQRNMRMLEERGVVMIEPEDGLLACGDVGKGRLAEPDYIVDRVLDLLSVKPDLAGWNVLVTAGATQETIDGVRYLSNHSSGKMGIAIAEAARDRGAAVTLVAGNVSVPLPDGMEIVRVTSTADMYEAVLGRVGDMDVVVKAAAPADYTVEKAFDNKYKGDTLNLRLVKTPDIAAAVGKVKGNCKLVTFAAETERLIENAQEKLKKKNADLMVANDLTQEGAGFAVDTNIVTFITENAVEPQPLMTKEKLAHVIWDKVLTL